MHTDLTSHGKHCKGKQALRGHLQAARPPSLPASLCFAWFYFASNPEGIKSVGPHANSSLLNEKSYYDESGRGWEIGFVVVSWVRRGRRDVQVKSFLSQRAHFIRPPEEEFHTLLINETLKQNVFSRYCSL